MEDKKKRDIEPHVHESVTDGKVIQKSKLQKALGVLLADDIENIKGSIVEDYIKPRSRSFMLESIDRIREFIADSVNGLVGAILFPKGRKKSSDSSGGYWNGKYVNYSKAYDAYRYGGDYYADNRKEKVPPTMLKQIAIRSRAEAQEVLGQLIAISKKYDYVSVGDYYELVSVIPSKEDYNYGWIGLADADIINAGGGWIIDLPRPKPLD